MADAPWTTASPAPPPAAAAARLRQHCACYSRCSPHPRRRDHPNMGGGEERWRLYHPTPTPALVATSISPASDRNLGGKEERRRGGGPCAGIHGLRGCDGQQESPRQVEMSSGAGHGGGGDREGREEARGESGGGVGRRGGSERDALLFLLSLVA